MRFHRAVLLARWSMIIASLDDWRRRARECSRETLMQWSYGTSFERRAGPHRAAGDRSARLHGIVVTVGMGVVQLETGYTYTYDDSDANGKHERAFVSGSAVACRHAGRLVRARLAWN